MKKYFCVSGFMRWDIFCKSLSSEIQNSLIATCNYKEHAIMIVDALNAQELAQFNERKEQRKSRPEVWST